MHVSFDRSRLNTITVVLKTETTLTNHTPCSLRVMDVVTGESSGNNSTELEMSPLEEVVLTHKEVCMWAEQKMSDLSVHEDALYVFELFVWLLSFL